MYTEYVDVYVCMCMYTSRDYFGMKIDKRVSYILESQFETFNKSVYQFYFSSMEIKLDFSTILFKT